jgi:hypothetical protein
MTIVLRPGCTVMFTGDSITGCFRLETEEALSHATRCASPASGVFGTMTGP